MLEIGTNPEKKEMEPTEVLRYMVQIGRDLEREADGVRAMIEEAKERGIPIDLSRNKALKKFAPLGEYEEILIKLRSELLDISRELFLQGVKMTLEDLHARREKIKESNC